MEFILNDKKITADIYPDDTIEMVCYKLSQVLGCSINDIYLFSKHEKTFTSSQVFKIVSHPFDEIPKFHLHNFLENLNQHVPPLTEELYHESDLHDYHNVLVDFPIGQTMVASVNPANVHDLEKYKNVKSVHQFQMVLLEYMPFFENKVYICLKKDFGRGYELYFDHTLDEESMKSKNKSLSELYLLPEPTVLEEGIERVVCRIDPIEPIIVPLDAIFNLLHTTLEMPMIQYNTGNDDTILYKLFSVNEDLKGNKIPVLQLLSVEKHDQSYKHSVTAIFDNIKIAFMNNGSIILDTSCNAYTIDQIDDRFRSHSSIIKQVGDFMKDSGYAYPTFTSIRTGTMLKLEFMMKFSIQHSKKNTCNYFFIEIDKDEKRYRRVSNFNESTLMNEICINGSLSLTETRATISAKIASIFHVTKQQAEEKVKDFFSTIDTSKKNKPKEKTGFSTRMISAHKDLTITMSDIKSLYYLDSIRKNMSAHVSSLSHKTNCSSDLNLDSVAVENVVDTVVDYDRYSSSDSDTDSDESMHIVDADSDTDESIHNEDSDSDESIHIEDEVGGGKRGDEDLIIKNPSFLIHRIKTYFSKIDPEYSRKCPRENRPVGLSKEEASHKNVKNYPKLQHNDATFICPMYWDMQNKVPLTEDQLTDKKVIPTDKKIDILDFDKHGTIYKLNNGTHPYPGLLNDNMGPCCYKKPQTNVETNVEVIESKRRIIENENRLGQYGQVSQLPQSLRYFFELPTKCNFEEGIYLLRYGVKEPHSFLDCIEACSNIMFANKLSREALIKKIGELATKGFYTYNNGNFPQQFTTVKKFIDLIPEMDYTYLWEIVCDIFLCNLVIFRVPNDTELEIVCPSNHYILTPFLPDRSTIMILEQHPKVPPQLEDKKDKRFLKRLNVKGACFEPLIEHNTKNNTHNLLHFYYNKYLQKTFEKILTSYKKCNSISTHYTSNVVAETMYTKLKKMDPHIKQIVNNHKCIGLSFKNVFIPCYPSIPIKAPVTTMPVSKYDETEKVLKECSRLVPCNPLFKVVKENEIIGIITETNSFVPCVTEEDHETTLPQYTSKVAHEYDTVPSTKDNERIKYITRSKVDKYMYASLRRLVKELASRNSELRKKLKELSQTKSITESVIEDIVKDHVSPVHFMSDDFIKEQLKCKGNCYTNNKLITTPTYYSKLANEINHYPRIATFITSPQLLIPDLPFSLHENEVLLMGSMVQAYYNELMEPKRLNDHYTTYDNVNPIVSSSSLFIVTKLGFIKI